MPLVSEFEGNKVYMYNNGREHNPPHFHVIFNDFQCIIDIERIKKIKRKIPKNKLRMVLVWCELHQTELLFTLFIQDDCDFGTRMFLTVTGCNGSSQSLYDCRRNGKT